MTRLQLVRIKNAMLLANGISNLIGVSIAMFLARQTGNPPSPEIVQLGGRMNLFFIPLSFGLPIILTVIYETPVRQFLNLAYREKTISAALDLKARRRLLNEPFFLIALDFCIWMIAAAFYPCIFYIFDAGREIIYRTFVINLFTGLITVTVAFFVFEHVLQKRVIPFLFPKGGLYTTPRTLHIRIRTRLIALLFACNIIPFIAIVNTAWSIHHSSINSEQSINQLYSAILISALIFIGVGIWVTILVSGNLTNPLHEIVEVLRSVQKGQYGSRVRVTSNDEIGYTGDVINEMNEGLEERELIKDVFGKYVAKEVRDEVLSGRIPLDGEKKEVTILFSDLRDFTPMTETHDPKLIIRIMNAYFKQMAEAIQLNGGLVLQFIGDEIYAVFGAPIFQPDHPANAFRAGLEMRSRLIDLNKEFEKKAWPNLRHGIGIHTGEALAANIGSPDRLSYLLVGDSVNLASRLQSLTKEVGAEMILSAKTYSRLSDTERSAAQMTQMPAILLKGKKDPIDVYAIQGGDSFPANSG
ncbi:MAG: adenylate/guanylate cyclase domain-containing protein [Pseudomonadota bacterium]